MKEKVDDQPLHYSWKKGLKYQRFTITTKNTAVLMELPPFPPQSLKLDFSHIKLHTGKSW